ncbi:DHA1 family chloramphenicol resistance protein-like MFS transporter [Actinoalloteichus hoggarensis]|uniref:Inner membrane transport protein YdhP n=1 Tax=Actinoalloteichus hoggarensis TaxID=1470176 RepID=A0A221W3Q7_9PSEU|nr:Cmx/CmrA family chloramphenicol efflux MFS transporter [Actinoalloteichus hoggarensis]ASO20502.1 Inner membrane transport protein YdhP [Actinoalloteichus hoggarensis]MBB5923542.1 DHA1 family chloramphenicol resistance protein-like MFS transporter [Actinoalloteichus hoggarensis]
MPFTIHLLALAVFAQGTSEFMLAGLGPAIAADLGVSIPAAGALTSAFAVGMIIGAPLMAVVSLRWPRRRALLAFLTVFLLVHVVGALTTSYEVLLVTRVIGALANAGFLAVALVTATGLAGPGAKGRATATLLGGVTLACVVGVPAGALLGQVWGWRSAFWAVALVSMPAIVAILRAVPAGGADGSVPSARRELRALRDPRLGTVLALAALVNGATFCTFTYLAPLITDVAGLGEGWVPAGLALFGIGSFLGVTLAGRIADVRPVPLLTIGGTVLCLGWVVLALSAGSRSAAIALILVQGTLSFAVGSTLVSQVLYVAVDAPRLAGGFATAAFNVGAALGPWLGGVAIDAGLGFRGPVWVSALLTAAALIVAGVAWIVTGGTGATARPSSRRGAATG